MQHYNIRLVKLVFTPRAAFDKTLWSWFTLALLETLTRVSNTLQTQAILLNDAHVQLWPIVGSKGTLRTSLVTNNSHLHVRLGLAAQTNGRRIQRPLTSRRRKRKEHFHPHYDVTGIEKRKMSEESLVGQLSFSCRTPATKGCRVAQTTGGEQPRVLIVAVRI